MTRPHSAFPPPVSCHPSSGPPVAARDGNHDSGNRQNIHGAEKNCAEKDGAETSQNNAHTYTPNASPTDDGTSHASGETPLPERENNSHRIPPVMEAAGVSKTFTRSSGLFSRKKTFTAVHDVSLTVHEGQTLGIIGESGCGKSTLAKMFAGLLAPSQGNIRIRGEAIYSRESNGGLAPLHPSICKTVQMVFQDPNASLNPRIRIGESVGEPLRCLYPDIPKNRRREIVREILAEVGIAPENANRYPHAFSGGQRQRIAIARALIAQPSVIICDEPTSSLDSSVQAQVLNLLDSIQKRHNLAYIFISHDLAVIRHMSDVVAVMYQGCIMEQGPAGAVFANPAHPYTQLLLDSVPTLGTFASPSSLSAQTLPASAAHAEGSATPPSHTAKTRQTSPHSDLACQESDVASQAITHAATHGITLSDPALPASSEEDSITPGRCPFAPRCPRASSICWQQLPTIGTTVSSNQRLVRCFHSLV